MNVAKEVTADYCPGLKIGVSGIVAGTTEAPFANLNLARLRETQRNTMSGHAAKIALQGRGVEATGAYEMDGTAQEIRESVDSCTYCDGKPVIGPVEISNCAVAIFLMKRGVARPAEGPAGTSAS